MSISHVVTGTATMPAANNGTSGNINTSGSDFLWVQASFFLGAVPPLLTDNQGNTYVDPITVVVSGTAIKHWFLFFPTVSATHTFTLTYTGSTISAALIVHGFSGMGGYIRRSGNTSSAATSVLPGTLNTNIDNELAITGLCTGNVTAIAVNNSMTQTTINFSGGANMAGASGWKIITPTGSFNPTWSWTTNADAASSMAMFCPAAGSAGGGNAAYA